MKNFIVTFLFPLLHSSSFRIQLIFAIHCSDLISRGLDVHASLCECRFHPDEEGPFQGVIRSQKTGTAGFDCDKNRQYEN